ncbi:MAG: hypothetical protein QM817_26060 [Archangium sp.]
MRDLPFEFRCRFCGFEEEVVVTVSHQSGEAEGLAHDRAERALTFYRCSRCGKRDLASIALKSFLFFVLANVVYGGVLFAGSAAQIDSRLALVLESPLIAAAFEWLVLLGVVVSLRNSGRVRRRSPGP